jgi:hypothetical protein
MDIEFLEKLLIFESYLILDIYDSITGKTITKKSILQFARKNEVCNLHIFLNESECFLDLNIECHNNKNLAIALNINAIEYINQSERNGRL